MDVKPNSNPWFKTVEKAPDNNKIYFEHIRFGKDWRVYFVGSASNTGYDGGLG